MNRASLASALAAFCILAAAPVQANDATRALLLTQRDSVVAPLPFESVTPFTLEAWVRPAVASQQTALFFFGDMPANGYGFYMHNGFGDAPGRYASLTISGVTYSATGNSAALAAGEWTHLAVSFDGNEWRMYRNGSLVGRGVPSMMGRGSARPTAPTGKFHIGPGFDGEIDELRVWSTVRSESEIRSKLYMPLAGSEPGLTVYYSMDDIASGLMIHNEANNGGILTAVVGGSTPTERLVPSTVPFSTLARPEFTLASFPRTMQFFPRDEHDSATVAISGSLTTPGFDSVVLTTRRNGQLVERRAAPLAYQSGGAAFAFSPGIRAELAEYAFELQAVRGGASITIAEAADVVSGDVFMVAGQSNMTANFPCCSNYQNEFLRSYGVMTQNMNGEAYDPADTLWGLANAHGFGASYYGPYMTGSFGNELQRMIMENFNVPVCIINVAAGGKGIELNIRQESDPNDLRTIYGRALYRAERSGLRRAIKGIFWYHGESNTDSSYAGYAANFERLYGNWKQDFPGVRQIYLFQIHQGCGAPMQSELREVQRRIPSGYSDVTLVPTAGMPGHDLCHFSLEGYRAMASQVFRLVARDFYGSSDTVNITDPKIDRAFYTTAERNEIALVFTGSGNAVAWPNDTLLEGEVRRMADYFYLDGEQGMVTSGRSSGDTVYLTLNESSVAGYLTYLPNITYNNSTAVYVGPWLYNDRKVGVASFDRLPIEQSGVSAVPARAGAAIGGMIELRQNSPNPCFGRTTIGYRLAPALAAEHAEISIIDPAGRVLRTIPIGGVAEGAVEVDLTGIPAGIYFYRLNAGGAVAVRRLVILQ